MPDARCFEKSNTTLTKESLTRIFITDDLKTTYKRIFFIKLLSVQLKSASSDLSVFHNIVKHVLGDQWQKLG
jgi:hypothetical protein